MFLIFITNKRIANITPHPIDSDPSPSISATHPTQLPPILPLPLPETVMPNSWDELATTVILVVTLNTRQRKELLSIGGEGMSFCYINTNLSNPLPLVGSIVKTDH